MDSAPPQHRTIFAVDVEGSTERTNTAKARYRLELYRLMVTALDAAGIDEHSLDPFIDSGDGVMALVHPTTHAPKTVMLNTVVPRLAELLSDLDKRDPEHRLRLRAVLHAGEVHHDDRGCYGEAMDIAFRLLNAPATKRELRDVAVPLVLVVSDHIYQCIVRHGYPGIDATSFAPLVRTRVGGRTQRGWIQRMPPDVDKSP
jgi:class 3 adenylate cyclase